MNIIADYDKVEYKRGSFKTFMKYSLRIFDLILVSLFAVAAIFCFTRFFSSSNKKNKILIVKTPHEKYAYSLNKNVEFTTEGSIGKTKIKIENGKVYIGEDAVLDVANVPDQEVAIGIRPEGFILDENGPMHCSLNNVEIMGRDVSIVSTNPASVNPVIRSIINADNKVNSESDTVTYSIKPHKIFLFNKETEERIYFEVK